MNNYKLIACDLDKTTLTTDLKLTNKTVQCMEEAIRQGKYVVFNTGRSLRLTDPYVKMVNGMRYGLICTGATGIDFNRENELFRHDIDEETVKWILSAAAGLDLLPFIFMGKDVLCPTWAADRADDFHVGQFEYSYRKYLEPVENPFATFMEFPSSVEKICFMFTNTMERDLVYEQIQNLPVSFTSISPYSLEINANGVSKAKGLRLLCKHIGISLSECVSIGDGDNDIELIREAGLGLAVSNAQKIILEAADDIVPDNDHDGVAFAIEKYLLD